MWRLTIAALLAGCGASPEGRGVISADAFARLLELSPATLPPPPRDATNAFADDAAAAAFGEVLFSTPIFAGRLLSGDNNGSRGTLGNKGETGKVACVSCHTPTSGFADDRSPSHQTSLASGWGKRRAPSLLDVGQSSLFMWDGRSDALYNQIFGALESPVEMNTSRLYVAQQVFRTYRSTYESLFGAMPPLDDAQRFPPVTAAQTGCTTAHVTDEPEAQCSGAMHGVPGDGAEFDSMSDADQDAVNRIVANVGKAIGAFERGLTCGPGRFDAFMHDDVHALSESEQRGAELFVTKGQCLGCHSGPFFSDEDFHNVGLAPRQVVGVFMDLDDAGASVGFPQSVVSPLNSKGPYSDGDDGRLERLPPALGSFRTPKLRCVAQRPSWFHTGHVISLEAVVEFFNEGGDKYGFLGASELEPLELTSDEIADLLAFLQAL